MLIRISLIVAIIAGLAVGTLNFVKVKEKITTLQANLDTETKAHREFEQKYNVTQKDLDQRTAQLTQTKSDLEATTAAKEKADAELAALTKKHDTMTEEFGKTKKDLLDVQQQLQAFKVSGYTAQQVAGFKIQFKKLEDNLAAVEGENKLLVRKVQKLETELAIYRDPNFFVTLPASCCGKILVTDPKWNFVVLNIGEDQGMLDRGEMLVNRNGRLVAKVIVRSVQKNRSIANVLPGWELGEVMEGDLVIPAHPAS
jgi:hypothetical protein